MNNKKEIDYMTEKQFELAITDSIVDTAHYFCSNINNKDTFEMFSTMLLNKDSKNNDIFFKSLIKSLTKSRITSRKQMLSTDTMSPAMRIGREILSSEEVSERASEVISYVKGFKG